MFFVQLPLAVFKRDYLRRYYGTRKLPLCKDVVFFVSEFLLHLALELSLFAYSLTRKRRITPTRACCVLYYACADSCTAYRQTATIVFCVPTCVCVCVSSPLPRSPPLSAYVPLCLCVCVCACVCAGVLAWIPVPGASEMENMRQARRGNELWRRCV